MIQMSSFSLSGKCVTQFWPDTIAPPRGLNCNTKNAGMKEKTKEIQIASVVSVQLNDGGTVVKDTHLDFFPSMWCYCQSFSIQILKQWNNICCDSRASILDHKAIK